jgi:hypothetical protein
MNTMDRLIEQLENTGREELARHEAAKLDPRLLMIEEMIAELAPAPLADGFVGGQQVFADLASSRHWRHMRAKSLRVARKEQIMGRRDCAWFWLRKAAEQRKSEKLWKARERSPLHALIVGSATPAPTERYERSEALQAAE